MRQVIDYENARFALIDKPRESGPHKSYSVLEQRESAVIGEVRWNTLTHGFSFFPVTGLNMTMGRLRDILHFAFELTREFTQLQRKVP